MALPDNMDYLTKPEQNIFKAYLLHHLYQSARQLCQMYYLQYSKFLKNYDQEDEMIDAGVIRFLINDIIATEEYNLEGVANYMRVPLDVIVDLVTGININPSLAISTKIIELHTTVRKPVYGEIIKKIAENQATYKY